MNEATLPSSEHTEVAILGAMLLEPDAVIEASGALDADDFFLDSHRRIYRAITHVASGGASVDYTVVLEELRRRKELDAVGGLGYLLKLTEHIPRRLNIASHVRIVKDHSRRRAFIRANQAGFDEGFDATEDFGSLAERQIERLREIASSSDDHQLQPIRAFLGQHDDAADLAESLAVRDGLRYGFAELDEATGGAHKAELIIIAARPSMGKTAAMCCIARHMAEVEGYNIAVFTLEQKAQAIIRRMLSAAARIDYQSIRTGNLTMHERALLRERSATLADSGLYIDDESGLTVSRIRSKAMRLKRDLQREGKTLDAILIDQLSKLSDADVAQRGMMRHERVGKMTYGLKVTAQELDVPVILLVQIGREGGKRSDPRPQLTDLKESGSIEEDADVVIFPHRPEYYDRTDDDLRGKGEFIIAKQREGPTKTCEVSYDGRIMRWEDKQDSLHSSYLTDRRYRWQC